MSSDVWVRLPSLVYFGEVTGIGIPTILKIWCSGGSTPPLPTQLQTTISYRRDIMQTLVLDQGYQPINSVPWTKAMLYIAKGKVDVLSEYDREIHFNMGMPAVVRIRHRIKPHQKKIKFSRQNVLARDKFRCQYCGARGREVVLTFDHVVPRSRGGRTEWENIVMACQECNHTKADRTPKEAGMKLLSKPSRPSWVPIFNLALRDIHSVPEEWRDYWTAELSP